MDGFRFPKLSMPDVGKITSDATTMFSRAKQFTEEKLGNAEKTEFDANFENLQMRYEKTKLWTEKLKAHTETVLQPNPKTRMEDFVYSKLDRKPPGRLNNAEQLGLIMTQAGQDFGPGTSYGGVLMKCGETQMKLGQAEQTFLQTTVQNFLLPLNKFLEGDSKTIMRERQTLETKRLDLDACKNRARKAKTLELRQQAERELQNAQTDFDRQQEITKLLLEGVSSTQAHHSRSLNEFVDTQLEYYGKCFQYMKDLQNQLKNCEPSPSFNRSNMSGRGTVQLGNIGTSAPSSSVSSSTAVAAASNGGSASNPTTSRPKQARVLYDYDASDSTELSLLADEIVTVYEHSELGPDWLIGQRGMMRGKVPASYLAIVE